MDANFYTTRRFIENLYQLKITHLDGIESIQQFCRTCLMHPIQSLLTPSSLARFIHHMRPASIYHINDQLQIHYLLLRATAGILIIGPFCTRIFSMNDCIQLLRHLNLSINLHTSLLAYRDQFPVLNEHQVINITRSFLDAIGEPAEEWAVREQEFAITSQNVLQETENILEKDHSAFIKAHYATEKQFMDDVLAGNDREAIFHLREQRESSSPLRSWEQPWKMNALQLRLCEPWCGLPPWKPDCLRSSTICCPEKTPSPRSTPKT